jgi:hypothetical protein
MAIWNISRTFGIFYGHSEDFTNIWDILWPSSTLCVHLVHFSGLDIMDQEKSGNPGRRPKEMAQSF